MKRIWKKLISTVLFIICALALTACGSAASETEDGMPAEDVKVQLLQSSQQLVEQIVTLTEEQIKSNVESGNAFAVVAMEAWTGSREELGGFVEVGEAKLTVAHETTTVTVPVKFEKENANFVLAFDKTYQATSLSIDIDYPMSKLMERAAMNTVMGLGTVFIILLFLSFLISRFKYIPGIVDKFGKKDIPEIQTIHTPVLADAQQEEELADDEELAAVIAAAIAASENTSTDGFVVRSIKKVNKQNWQRA